MAAPAPLPRATTSGSHSGPSLQEERSRFSPYKTLQEGWSSLRYHAGVQRPRVQPSSQMSDVTSSTSLQLFIPRENTAMPLLLPPGSKPLGVFRASSQHRCECSEFTQGEKK